MSRAIAAADTFADWTIRLYEDVILIRSFWRLLRAVRDPSPMMRVKLTTAQAMLSALRAEENARIMRAPTGTCAERGRQ